MRAQVLTYLNEADRTEGGDNCDGILRTGSQDLMIELTLEPATLALLTLGLLGLGIAARCRRSLG